MFKGKLNIIISFMLLFILFILCLNLKMFKVIEGRYDDSKRISKKQKRILDESTLSKEELEAKNDPSSVRRRFA